LLDFFKNFSRPALQPVCTVHQ